MSSHPEVLGNRYLLVKRIGSGGFGKVFLANDAVTGANVIVKQELRSGEDTLEREAEIYQLLKRVSWPSFPKMFYHGCDRYGKGYIVLEELGPSLHDIQKERRYLSSATIAKIGIQMVRKLEILHNFGYIHCDLHVSNILRSKSNRNELHMIDFGSAISYRDRSGNHISSCVGITLRMQIYFAPLAWHKYQPPTRMWDLETLSFVFKTLHDGSLPWDGVKTEDEIKQIKDRMSPRQIFDGMAEEFTSFLVYCRNSPFGHNPNYAYLKGLLRNIIAKKGDQCEDRIDW